MRCGEDLAELTKSLPAKCEPEMLIVALLKKLAGGCKMQVDEFKKNRDFFRKIRRLYHDIFCLFYRGLTIEDCIKKIGTG